MPYAWKGVTKINKKVKTFTGHRNSVLVVQFGRKISTAACQERRKLVSGKLEENKIWVVDVTIRLILETRKIQ